MQAAVVLILAPPQTYKHKLSEWQYSIQYLAMHFIAARDWCADMSEHALRDASKYLTHA